MSTRILLPVDRSEHALAACKLALELFDDGTFVFLHVIDPAEASFSTESAVPNIPEGWYEQEQTRADRIFEELESLADSHGHETERRIEVGKPGQTIVDTAGDDDVDHIVMGSHGRKGVSRLLLGSVAETVVRLAPVPVTVARTDSDER